MARRPHYKYVPYAFGAFCILLAASAYLSFTKKKEGLYNFNPCGDAADCKTCAGRAGCGWCSDVQQCMPMARDGFPQRRPSEDNLPACTFLQFRNEREKKLCDVMTKAVIDQRPVCNPFAFIIDERKC